MKSAHASMGEMGPFLWTGSMRNEVRVPLLLPVIPRLAAVDTSLSWTLSRLPRGGRWGGASRVPGMDSCSEAGMTVEPRRARARGYPEGGYGAGPLPRPRDGFLLKGRIDGGTTPCPRTRVPRGGYGAGPLPRPRDGFLLGGRNDGGTTSCPRTLVPRGGYGAGPLPHPRDGFLLKGRNDGGTTPCPRTRVPRGGIWGRASPASQGWIPARRQD